MTKKIPAKKVERVQQEQKKKVESVSRVLQGLAIVAVIAIYLIPKFGNDGGDIPVWVPAALLGVAVGFSPDQILSIVKEVIKVVLGRKS